MTRDAVLLDFDGTLCDVRKLGRLGQDLERWHAESVNCPPHPAVVSAAREAHAAGRALVILTSRQRRYAGLTVRWLAKEPAGAHRGEHLHA